MTGVLTQVFGVFDSVGQWISEQMGTLTAMFYNAETSSLTLLGTLAVCGLAFSVVFLLIGIIQRFFKFGA